MSLWSEAEFLRVALSTKLGERTIDACRAVLVDGVGSADVARQHKMFQSQVSRSVATLREKQANMVESATNIVSDNESLLKFAVTQIAKNMMGDGFDVRNAAPGCTYEGQALVNSHGFVVQKVGRSGVLHDLASLPVLPPLNRTLSIAYPLDGGKAVVSDITPTLAQSVNLER